MLYQTFRILASGSLEAKISVLRMIDFAWKYAYFRSFPMEFSLWTSSEAKRI